MTLLHRLDNPGLKTDITGKVKNCLLTCKSQNKKSVLIKKSLKIIKMKIHTTRLTDLNEFCLFFSHTKQLDQFLSSVNGKNNHNI